MGAVELGSLADSVVALICCHFYSAQFHWWQRHSAVIVDVCDRVLRVAVRVMTAWW